MTDHSQLIARHDFAIIGGGIFGMSFAYGLARLGHDVVLLDKDDHDFRAARGNFGLVWVQGKGFGCPAYTFWTRLSSDLWPDLNEELMDETGIDLEYRRDGGFSPCLAEANLEALADKSRTIATEYDPRYTYEVLDAEALAGLVPTIGKKVVGGLYCPHDGHVNPLALLHALTKGFVKNNGTVLTHAGVSRIEAAQDGYALTTPRGVINAERVIIAAGLGTRDLAAQVGMDVPVGPNRGQVLVLERTEALTHLPNPIARFMGNGTVQIGVNHEDVGLDRRTTLDEMAGMAQRAVATFPALDKTRVLRAWGCLRTMTPDAFPVYEQSEKAPGIFAAVAHSGITLAAAHVFRVAGALAKGQLPEDVLPLNGDRFHV